MKKAIEVGEDAEKMLQHYIYNHMKRKNLHDVAEIYAQEANLESSQLARCEESLLTEWWESFWPTFCSRLSNEAGANAQSSGQPSMVNALSMLASLKNQGASSSQQTPMDPQQDVLPENHASSLLPLLDRNQQSSYGLNNYCNLIAHSPAEFLSAPGIYPRRTGKLPMNTVSDSILGQSAANPLLVADAFGNECLGFAPVEFLPGQALVGANMLYTMQPSGSQSHLQLPATMETPAQGTKEPKYDGLGRCVEMELTCPVGPNSSFTDHAGETNWNNQLPPTGVGMAVLGPDLYSYKSRLPDSFLQFFHQTVDMYMAGSYPPPEQF
ncbi:hypothetical protein POM88_036282 [Heracleum sosnowskyi]|uniref:LisH domain-containing protein n=1 Tax=Heracleum sosnowskyi TaxID=360622 RepID=A0AAD8HMW5_9APIA|nr:hypothetical protein POM88_036282 [Heracleum sosnowskyi]